MKKLFLLIALLFVYNFVDAQVKLEGDWYGSINIGGGTFDILAHFENNSGGYTGKMDVVTQHQKDLKLDNIKYEYPNVSFILNVSNGVAKFEGKFEPDVDNSFGGVFSQMGYEGTFNFLRGVPEKKEEVKKEETEKPVYKEEEVKFTNGDITLAGTLSVPPYPGKHPAMIMITGSGPQNRDEEIVDFKIFKIIADQVVKSGVAVLRYDDRGVGSSTGKSVNEYTSEDFSTDINEAIKFLQKRSDIDPKQIGLFGHSEGGIIAPMVAAKNNDVAFIICMAGTGVTGEEILIEQSKLIMQASKVSEQEINTDLGTLKKLINAIKTNGDFSEVLKSIKETRLSEFDKLPETQKSQIKNKDEWAESYAQMYLKSFNTIWMRYFLQYNPEPALEKVKCPALLLFGGLDLQVPPAQNLEIMKQALIKGKNKDFDIKIFDKANHLFQEAITGNPSEYEVLKKEFTPGFLKYITDWLSKRVKVSR